MITKNKTKDVFLTKKQLKDRDTAGTLEEGVIYNTIDEPAGHALKVVNGTLQLLDVDGNAISEATLPPEYDTVELSLDLSLSEDSSGKFTTEQTNLFKSFKNVTFLKVKNSSNTSDSTTYIFTKSQSQKIVKDDTVLVFAYANYQNDPYAVKAITITTLIEPYTYRIRNVNLTHELNLTNIIYNVNGTLSSDDLKTFKDSKQAIIAIKNGDNYLTYVKYSTVSNMIKLQCSGFKDLSINNSTGAYTFEESSADVTVQKIFDLTEDSDTVVREIDSKTGKVNIHLATTISNKVNNALQMPTTQPTELLMVGLSTSKAQTNIPLGSSLKLENGHLETAIKIVRKTQTEYDALTSYDANTMYVIVG